MAPTDMKFDEAQDSGSQDGSQTLDVQQLLEKHKTAVTTRRRKVEAELRQSHKQGFDDLQRRHDEYKVQYEESLKSTQRPYLEKLAELIHKKKLLETEIEKLLDNLQQADASVTQQLDACIKIRVNALRK